ncbi:MAG: hypothetical protein P4L35_03195 [Ignavibacteriaceae bacterium]|nr:hypothetical protein [Ignavibacteriaceae bacterium]
MGYVFCIQPFDGSVYDKRFDDVFQPAIEKAGLDAYRVDRDPAVNIPIEDIEKRIRNSDLCFAEISTDNPNVWFELGYAIAVPRNVVMVCSTDRGMKFPFDIQHRNIIRYKSESSSDFTDLQEKITQRILALIKSTEELDIVSKMSLIADTEGLSQHEMVGLVSIMQNSFSNEDSVGSWTVKNDMNKAGFTDIAVSLALRGLADKGLVATARQSDQNGNEYFPYIINEAGYKWLMGNQDKLKLRKEVDEKEINNDTDDLPF